jgi:predicted small metal-binding protein
MPEQVEAQWQVTCPCGWRTHGTKSEVVAAVQDHGRSAHAQELTESQVMDLAVRTDAPST